MNNALTAADFWQFCLKFYRQSAVKDSCLSLQDEYDLNVNLLLLCSYLNHTGWAVNDFTPLQQSLSTTDRALKPLRRSRRACKDLNQSVYQQLLDAELVLEKQQQEDLVGTLSNCLSNQPKDNLLAYCRFAKIQRSETVNSLLEALYLTL